MSALTLSEVGLRRRLAVQLQEDLSGLHLARASLNTIALSLKNIVHGSFDIVDHDPFVYPSSNRVMEEDKKRNYE